MTSHITVMVTGLRQSCSRSQILVEASAKEKHMSQKKEPLDLLRLMNLKFSFQFFKQRKM